MLCTRPNGCATGDGWSAGEPMGHDGWMSTLPVPVTPSHTPAPIGPGHQMERLVLGGVQLAGTAVAAALGRSSMTSGRGWDAALGAGLAAGKGLATTGQVAMRLLGPVAQLALHPPLVPASRHPAGVIDAWARRGRREREAAREDLVRVLTVLIPAVTELLLEQISLTDIVRRHVDLDAIVAGVDLDAVAERLDVNAVIDRLDLTEIVIQRVDLDAVVAGVDLDAVAARLDVDAVARRLDIDAVIDRIDLVGLAEQVINAIDLPEIIRQSTGSVASEAVRGVRMQSIDADEAVARIVDRLFLRRRQRSTSTGREPSTEVTDHPAEVGDPRGPS